MGILVRARCFVGVSQFGFIWCTHILKIRFDLCILMAEMLQKWLGFLLGTSHHEAHDVGLSIIDSNIFDVRLSGVFWVFQQDIFSIA